MLKRLRLIIVKYKEMAESKFILYVRKFLKNPLLARKQVVSEPYLTMAVPRDHQPRLGQPDKGPDQRETRKGAQGEGRVHYNLWYED